MHFFKQRNAIVAVIVFAACVGMPLSTSNAASFVDDLDIFEAIRTGDIDSIKSHIDNGIDFNGRDPQGITPLCWAATLEQLDAVEVLLERGADVDGRNEDGVTPLIAAAFFGRVDSVRMLLEKNADANARNQDGAGALDVMSSSWKDTERMAEILQVEVERGPLEAGRKTIGELIRQAGGEEGGGNTLFVPAVVFGSITAVAALVAVIIWLIVQHEKKRTAALNALAPELGLEFEAAADDQLLAKVQGFALFNKGYGRKMKNVMKAETEAARLTIFDYQFTTGGGKESRTHHHTVVAMEADSLRLSGFSLRPEGLFDRNGSAIGLQDIDFDNHQDFSNSFVLKGHNEAAVRNFFDTEMLDLFATRKGISVESANGLFIYFHGGRKKPEQIQQLMTDGFDLYAAFEQRNSRGG